MRIEQDSIPPTVEAAANAFVAALNDDERTMVLNDTVPDLHTTVGMGLRNAWGLWQDSPIRRDAINTYRIAHGDDISGLILAWAFAKIRNEPFDPIAYCERYHKHWAEQGMTSLQAGEIS